jgi:hypothetical protein
VKLFSRKRPVAQRAVRAAARAIVRSYTSTAGYAIE